MRRRGERRRNNETAFAERTMYISYVTVAKRSSLAVGRIITQLPADPRLSGKESRTGEETEPAVRNAHRRPAGQKRDEIRETESRIILT